MSKQYENPQATEDPRPGRKQGCLSVQSELMESFGEKFMLIRVPGQVPKETLDEYFGPWTCKWVEPVPGRSPWISRIPAAKTNHS